MTGTRFLVSVCALSTITVVLAASALAQNYPSRPIRIVVPYLAGGGVDTAARVVGQKLGEAFWQSISVSPTFIHTQRLKWSGKYPLD